MADEFDVFMAAEAASMTSSEANILYISAAGGTPNPSSAVNSTFGNCGHSSHGAWGGCPSTSPTSAPAACAGIVPN